MTIEGRRKISRAVKLMSPGYSVCGCCKWPWNRVEHKSIQYDPYNGLFAICKECYAQLISEEKYDEIMNYYLDLFDIPDRRNNLANHEMGKDNLRNKKINQILN